MTLSTENKDIKCFTEGCDNWASVVDTDENKYYCSECWHSYPTGFKTRGWDFYASPEVEYELKMEKRNRAKYHDKISKIIRGE